MTLVLKLASNPHAIAESQYATARQFIEFTPFTSCIGVGFLANNNSVFAVHLALYSKDGTLFSAADVAVIETVMQQTGVQPGTGIVLGQIAFWSNNVPQAYAALVQNLGIMDDKCYQFGDGTYGMEIGDDGGLQPTFGALGKKARHQH